MLAAGAVGLTWAIWEYQHLSADVGHAQTRLPRVISAALKSGAVTRDSTNVTLVRGYGGLATGSTLLFRSDSAHHQFSFLRIPARLSILPPTRNATIDGAAVARLTEWLRAGGIPVNHVALLNFGDIGAIVDALGGITVSNRTAFDVLAGGSQAVHFPVGSLRLDGAQTVMFLSVATKTKASRILREQNEAEVLRGVIDTGTRSENVSHLLTTAKTIADNSATDLTTSNILALVAVRMRATRIVDCNLSHVTALDTAAARSAVRVFSATAKSSPECQSRATAPVLGASVLGAGAAVLSNYGISALVTALVIVICAMIAATVIALLPARRVLQVGASRAVRAPGAIVLPSWRRVVGLYALIVAAARGVFRRIGENREMPRQRRRYGPSQAVRLYTLGVAAAGGVLNGIGEKREARRQRRGYHSTRLQHIRDGLVDRIDDLRETAGRRSRRDERAPLRVAGSGTQNRVASPESTGDTGSTAAVPADRDARGAARPESDPPDQSIGRIPQPSVPASSTSSENKGMDNAAPRPVPPEERLSDRVDLVAQLRRDGLSYREIADRLSDELDHPVSASKVRELYSQALGTESSE